MTTPNRVFTQIPHPVTRLQFSQDSLRLAGIDSQSAFWHWDLEQGVPLKIILPDPPATAMCLLDAKTAALGGGDGAVRFYNLQSGICERVFPAHPEAAHVEDVIRGDNRQFAYQAGDGDLAYGATQDPHGKYYGHAGPVTALAALWKGRYLATAGQDRTLRLWDCRSGKCCWLFGGERAAFPSPLRGCWECRNGLAAWGRTFEFWRIPIPGFQRVLAWFFPGKIRSLDIQADALAPAWNGRIAAAAAGSMIRLLSLKAGQELACWDSQAGRTLALALSPDGRWLASGHEDRTVRLWPLE